MVVKDCFSNSPDEFILEFEHFTIKCLFLDGEIYFFLSVDTPSKSRLFKPQFSEIIGLKVTDVVPHPFERSFHIELENDWKIAFKCHGRKSNVILYEGRDNFDIFKSNLEKDSELPFDELWRPIDCKFIPAAFQSKTEFTKTYPYLPSEFFEIKECHDSKGFEECIEKHRRMQSIVFDRSSFEISSGDGNELLSDISYFSAYSIRHKSFASQKALLLKQCQDAIRDKERFIQSNLNALDTLRNKRPDGEFGNIILANMHLIKAGDKKALVNDIYHNCQIEVQLDEKLGPVENAERYFKKEKGLPHSIRLLESKISKARETLISLENKLQTIISAQDLKALKPLVKTEDKVRKEEQLPYRKFNYLGFEILVGKHAESNEKLLNYFSDKNDVWMHAKDVGGSHVILKSSKYANVPENVMEYAASIAAYYSKSRNQNLATVTYTLRKFVRKIKGAEKGKVTVSNEKTLLVKPSKGDSIS